MVKSEQAQRPSPSGIEKKIKDFFFHVWIYDDLAGAKLTNSLILFEFLLMFMSLDLKDSIGLFETQQLRVES